MTTTNAYGYLEGSYLNANDQYLTGEAEASDGMQSTFVIADEKEVAMQVSAQILEFTNAQAMQVQGVIADDHVVGMQSELHVADESNVGMQTLFSNAGFEFATACQVLLTINDYLNTHGMEIRFDKGLVHTVCGYLEHDYLEEAYLAGCFHGNLGMQMQGVVAEDVATAFQVEAQIIENEKETAMQALFHIVDFTKLTGMQVDTIKVTSVGMQTLVSIYNTDHLRIMCEFPSRGIDGGVGNNSWGNPIGTGQNWQANSTEPGDFLPKNLNTDVVEQYWRTATGVVTGINLDCDTEINQGVFIDTLAMLGHNITRSATVTLLGSNVSNFSTIGVTIPLVMGEDNTYYIAPELPASGYRYWRLQIDDSTNPDGFIKIGTIVFGNAQIFAGEMFVDELQYTLKDFADTVKTEGFTNVSNSRTQKAVLRLDFRFLDINKGNYRILRNMFKNERTVLKCLYIPTPTDDNDQDVLGRFAVFGKLTAIPTEQHSYRGADAQYVGFAIEVDESL